MHLSSNERKAASLQKILPSARKNWKLWLCYDSKSTVYFERQLLTLVGRKLQFSYSSLNNTASRLKLII